MPHVHIFMYPGRTNKQKEELAKRIVDDMSETVGAPEDAISISFEEVAPEDWDEHVVKPFIADKKQFLFKRPGYDSKYL